MNQYPSISPYISGFTFIKNGLSLGYPIRESVLGIGDFCDEVIINVGYDDPSLKKDDGTYEYLRDHFPSSKFKFVKSWWNPAASYGGEILAEQTNIALQHCRGKFCQYIQGDEAIHEDDVKVVLEGVKKMEQNGKVQGLVFKYLHFYGNVNIIKHTRNTYRREVRLIRNNCGIKSWKDAQGFRHDSNEKLNCIQIPARIFHYGWARLSTVMRRKIRIMDGLYSEGKEIPESEFEYRKIWGLKQFKGTHPSFMQEWIEKNKNPVDILGLKYQFEWKDIGLALSDFVESMTGHRIGEYKNFKLI